MDLFSLLKEHNLRHTSGRATILSLFNDNKAALSHADIEGALPEGFDRVTIYRTLKSFTEKGLIHKIADTEGILRYALCSHNCTEEKHEHDHVHFKCSQCGETTCIDDVPIPTVDLPKGYKTKEVSLLVEGNCPKCA